MDEKARGAFIGLSAMHQKGDLIRAVLEGVTFSQRQCLDILRDMGMAPDMITACGGGARSPFWRQMLADILGCTIQTSPLALEGPALGAAILAGVCAGVYDDVATAADAIVRPGQQCRSDEDAAAQYEPFYQLYQSLYPALKSSFDTLSVL